jgi:ATP-dependent DNA helicase RecG
LPQIHIVDIENRTIIEIKVENSIHKPHFYNASAYKRVGTTNLAMSADEIRYLLKTQDNSSFESKIIDSFDFNDIDWDLLNDFAKKANEKRMMNLDVTKSNDKTILQKLNLIKDGKATVALVLCFCKNPCKYIPYYSIKLGVLSSDTFSIQNLIFQSQIEKPLLLAVDEIYNSLQRFIVRVVKIEKFERIEKPIISQEVLREFLMNALIHCDYSIASPIYVLVAKNYIQISNPGNSLLKPIIQLYSKHHSVARNPLIANVFFLAGFVDRWGEGISMAISNLSNSGLSLPSFRDENNFFYVKLAFGSNEIDDQLIALLKKPHTTNELSNATKTSVRTIRYRLSILTKKGIVKFKRNGRSVLYFLNL